MRAHDSESEAMRREWLAGTAGFFFVFAAGFSTAVYFLFAYFLPEKGWLDTIVATLQVLMFAAILGIYAGGLATAAVRRHHYAAGVYRCYRCNRVLRGPGIACVCMPREQRATVRRHSKLRHYRRLAGRVLFIYLALLVPTLILTHFAHRPRVTSADVAFLHACFCLLLAIGMELTGGVLEFLHRGMRFRLRSEIYRRALAIWSLLVIAVGLICHTFGVDLLSKA